MIVHIRDGSSVMVAGMLKQIDRFNRFDIDIVRHIIGWLASFEKPRMPLNCRPPAGRADALERQVFFGAKHCVPDESDPRLAPATA